MHLNKTRKFTLSLAAGVLSLSMLFAGVAGAKGGNSTLTLHNPYWNPNVLVQTRIGNNANPEANPAGPTLVIPKDGARSISTAGEDVFYRRYRDPHNPKSGWRTWTHQSMSEGHSYDTNVD